MINLIVIAALIRWQTALLMLAIGVYSAVAFFRWYTGLAILPDNNIALEFKFIYAVLLITGSLVMFLKPKQEYQELTEEKVGHLTGRIDSQEKQVQEAEALKSEFIRNVAHEYHAPMTGVMSMAENLYAAYDKLNDRQRREAVEIIYKSAIRLDSYDTNLTTLSKLSQAGYDLKLERVDLSSLIYDQVQICRRLYEEDKEDREFVLDIEEGIIVNGDKGYLVQLLDNLIINAIKYCKKGKITASLTQTAKGVHFALSDEGIGIPKSELYNIFNPFTVSSKTRTSAGGRGVGLALCKRIVEIHEGKIWAESDGEKGTVFIVELPL
jgi:signal transduction histidine kinase